MILDNATTNKVVKYIKEKYVSEPEYLWIKTPNNAVFRHSSNSKWFAAILNIPKNKIGLEGDGNINILDLKCDPILIGSLRDKENFLPAYHMNKEHWISILLKDGIDFKEVFSLIDMSYNMTLK